MRKSKKYFEPVPTEEEVRRFFQSSYRRNRTVDGEREDAPLMAYPIYKQEVDSYAV
jgi:hypothetical protein